MEVTIDLKVSGSWETPVDEIFPMSRMEHYRWVIEKVTEDILKRSRIK